MLFKFYKKNNLVILLEESSFIGAEVCGTVIWNTALTELENILKINTVDEYRSFRVTGLIPMQKHEVFALLFKIITFMEKIIGSSMDGLKNYNSRYTANICKDNIKRLSDGIRSLKLIVTII